MARAWLRKISVRSFSFYIFRVYKNLNDGEGIGIYKNLSNSEVKKENYMLVTINEVVVFIIKAIVIYAMVYGVVDRVCRAAECRAYAKYVNIINEED